MLTISNEVLEEDHRNRVCDWIAGNEYLSAFENTTENKDTKRSAFAVTYSANDLPFMLKFFKQDERTNIYNIIGIVTINSGDIPEHVDDDFECYMKESNVPPLYIRSPRTTSVYYASICPTMVGGDTVFTSTDPNKHPITIGAEQNSMVTFSSNMPHSVTSMKCEEPRIVLVCERYKLPRIAMKHFNTPIFRKG